MSGYGMEQGGKMRAKIRTLLIDALGEGLAGTLHAFRFAWLLKYCPEFYEPEIGVITSYLSEGDVAVDVGASGADWTYSLARKVSGKGKVFSFEADPYYARATQKVIWLLSLKNVSFFPYGLSDRDEMARLKVRDRTHNRYSGRSYVVEGGSGYGKDSVAIELRTLDRLSDEYPDLLKIKFIKCDVEGYELKVFRGAARIIQTARPIVVAEVGRDRVQGAEESELYRFFAEKSYCSFALSRDGQLVRTDKKFACIDAFTDNRFLIPDEEVDRIVKTRTG